MLSQEAGYLQVGLKFVFQSAKYLKLAAGIGAAHLAGHGPGMLEIKCPYKPEPWVVPPAYYMAQVKACCVCLRWSATTRAISAA